MSVMANSVLYIKPYTLAQAKARLTKVVLMQTLSRLMGIGRPLEEEVEVQLSLHELEMEAVGLKFSLKTRLALECCRCLKEQDYTLHLDKEIWIAKNQEIAFHLEQTRDTQDGVVVCGQDLLNLTTLIEDEIILQLPEFPMHQTTKECDAIMLEKIQTFTHQKAANCPFGLLKDNLKSVKKRRL